MHPIVALLQPSTEQQPAILERGRDVVVTAGAGTGKTRTLVARYLSLLADGVPLRRIVAITFTVKAAREMRNRVRDEIRAYLALTPPPADYDAWLQISDQIDAARISTVHGLCSEILRSHPAEAGIDPRFDMLAEGAAALLREQVFDETMAWAADEQDGVALFELLGEDRLRSTLEELLRRRLDARRAFQAMPDDVLGHWESELARRQEKCLERLQADSRWNDAIAVLEENQADDPCDLLEQHRRETLAILNQRCSCAAERIATICRLQSHAAGRSGAARKWPGGAEQVQLVRDAICALRGAVVETAPLLGACLNDLDRVLAAAVPAIRRVFEFAEQHYTALKSGQAAFDFDDLEAGALDLLIRSPDVRALWQSRIQALLVDEFQDTNARQRDLVRLLAGKPGTLFLVGDAKQSIYRFRGADVAVFRNERLRVIESDGLDCHLATSYRAHDALIRALNDLLAPVLGEQADDSRPWVEPFSPLRPPPSPTRPIGQPPYIELHLTVGTRDPALRQAADLCAARILELRREGQAEFGDVVVLCRAASSFSAYETAFEQAGIPFLTVAGRGFYGRSEIRDLLNALTAVADPADDLALVGLLRSPAIGLSDPTLFELCQQRAQGSAGSSLWVNLSRWEAATSDESDRVRGAARLIADLRARAGRTSVADLLKAFLDATHYRAVLLEAGQSRSALNVSKLLADAHSSGIVSVPEFVEYVRSLRRAGAREGEARSNVEGAVQIMSVHAAKGLEFPIVVIGDAGHGEPRFRELILDPAWGVLLPLKDRTDKTASAAYTAAKWYADDQEEAESFRLFYVAATRAQQRLIVSGHMGKLGKNGCPAKPRGWLGLLADDRLLGLCDRLPAGFDEHGDARHRLDLHVGASAVACTLYEAGCRPPLPGGAAVSVPGTVEIGWPPDLLAPYPTAPEGGRDERPNRVWRIVPAEGRGSAPAWVVGSLVHQALTLWRFPGPGFEDEMAAAARTYGLLDARQIRDATARARRLLERFAGHPLRAEIEQAEQRAHEVPYSRRCHGRLETGIIDLLYLTAGQWTVVDFKTDHLTGEAAYAARLDSDFRAQAEQYRSAVAELLDCRPRYLLCLLDYAGQVSVRQVAA